jgi:hypothetical protein
MRGRLKSLLPCNSEGFFVFWLLSAPYLFPPTENDAINVNRDFEVIKGLESQHFTGGS